ncbi:MAG: TolC family protein [Spirochaetaceae bacterium]|nr:TolC family protein [Spirochaetaceae bacterium]MCF7950750.1 TolC family protein [Spirochaetaceae bacterium]
MKLPPLRLECFILLLSMFWPALPAAEPLSIAEAILQAQKSDLQLQQLEKRLQQVRNSVSPQLRARLPRVFVEYKGSESYGLEDPYRLTHNLAAGIEVELTDQGRSWFSAQQKTHEIERLMLEIRLRKETITSQLIELCLDILYSKAAIEHMSQLLELYTRHLHSTDQQYASATISAHSYRRLRLEFESKQLEVAAEELSLQNLYSRLGLYLGSEPPTIPKLKGSLPRIYTGSIGSRLPSQPAFYQKAAEENNTEVIRQEIQCRSTAARLSLKLRQYCPQTTVFARIDFRGSEFPPASPYLSFGLQLSGGAGRMGVTAGNTSNYSSYTYTGSPTAQAAVDFSQKEAETRGMVSMQLQQARRKLQVIRSSAGTQALRLSSELSHLKEVQKNLLAQTQLHRESCSIKAKQFDFGNRDLRELVEAQQTYMDSRLKLYRIIRSCLEVECSLLQVCGLSRHIPEGGFYALQ